MKRIAELILEVVNNEEYEGKDRTEVIYSLTADDEERWLLLMLTVDRGVSQPVDWAYAVLKKSEGASA